jgi:adenine/guanine phosphoribosyltransferase-like PRPP-binding protein
LASYQDTFEMQADAIKPGQTVVVVDDLIATGKAPFPSIPLDLRSTFG